MLVTLSHCSKDMADQENTHNEFGQDNVTFSAVWPDGVTDPLVVTQN